MRCLHSAHYYLRLRQTKFLNQVLQTKWADSDDPGKFPYAKLERSDSVLTAFVGLQSSQGSTRCTPSSEDKSQNEGFGSDSAQRSAAGREGQAGESANRRGEAGIGSTRMSCDQYRPMPDSAYGFSVYLDATVLR